LVHIVSEILIEEGKFEMHFDQKLKQFVGPGGSLPVMEDDEATIKLAMLLECECGDEGPAVVAARFGFSRQRYYQIKKLFLQNGVAGIVNKKRGPKTMYRRSEEVVCQVIRHRFLDPDATAAVIAQKLKQCGFQISIRSVERIIEQFGLQKKTLRLSPQETLKTS
jgi:hypothetical protein